MLNCNFWPVRLANPSTKEKINPTDAIGMVEQSYTGMPIVSIYDYISIYITRLLNGLIFKIAQNIHSVPILILLDGNDPTRRV